jgi:hypothetical protein
MTKGIRNDDDAANHPAARVGGPEDWGVIAPLASDAGAFIMADSRVDTAASLNEGEVRSDR